MTKGAMLVNLVPSAQPKPLLQIWSLVLDFLKEKISIVNLLKIKEKIPVSPSRLMKGQSVTTTEEATVGTVLVEKVAPFATLENV